MNKVEPKEPGVQEAWDLSKFLADKYFEDFRKDIFRFCCFECGCGEGLSIFIIVDDKPKHLLNVHTIQDSKLVNLDYNKIYEELLDKLKE